MIQLPIWAFLMAYSTAYVAIPMAIVGLIVGEIRW